MKATYIDYSDTHSFSSTVISYLAQDSKLLPFINRFPELENFEKLIAERNSNIPRRELSTTLLKQYEKCCIPENDNKEVYENLRALARENTFTVTTGHQLNIFTGPLYFIYKIVSTINLARDLKQRYPEYTFVPVYWMATEDHDFEEINHVDVHNKRISWNIKARGATGELDTYSIAECLKEYASVLGLGEEAEKWTALVENAYLGQQKLADATRVLVNSLFAAYGLVVVDANDHLLKKSFAPYIEDDILGQHSFRLISETSSQLEELGFRTQVNPRDINFFYMTPGFRERIVKEDNTYKVLNSEIQFTEDELREEIHQNPERFSPNVIMRPLYQEIILPNLAYIGGGAELTYWLQLKKNFDHYGVSYPAVLLRNSALLVNDQFAGKLCRLKISFKDIFNPVTRLQSNWVTRNSSHTLNLTDEKSELNALFEKIKLKAHKIDPTLTSSAAAVNQRLQHAINNLEKKLVKAEKHNHAGAMDQIAALRSRYFPNEGLQERSENFGLYYTQYGNRLISELIKHLKPLDFKFCILEP